MKPKVKAVQYPDWEEDCSSNQEPPHCLSKASEDVCEPCNKASQPNKCSPVHINSLIIDFNLSPWLACPVTIFV
jgi:hypothetical protein